MDAATFDDLVTAGRAAAERHEPERAVRFFDDALALWRGPAFADVVEWDFAALAAAGLHGRRDAVILDRLGTVSDLGDHDAAAAQLRSIVEREPLLERAWELLALAEYRAGRQAAAMATFRRARAVLADELGAEPGPGLTALYEKMLRHDPVLIPRRTPEKPTRRTRYVPAELTTLIGRDAAVAAVARQVDEHRLVALTGPGGVGKTRVAQRVANDSDDADGPWFVELAGVHDTPGISDALVNVLGLTAQGGVDMVGAMLRDRRCLVVLDNCEHLVESVAVVAEKLLRECPGLRILATSRVALGAEGERVHPLSPLVDGTDLFYERSAEPVGESERENVRRLCEALDNLPLALELAAAHTSVLSVTQLLDRLDDRFALLKARSSRTRGRHLSMRMVIDASYTALAPSQQTLMQQLAIFEGGFDFDAAAAVSGRGLDVLVDLAALVDASLVTVVGGDPRRYQMLEVLREYAAGEIPGDVRSAAVSAHVEWIRALAGDAYPGLRGPDCITWMRRIEAELPNVRAALAHCRDADIDVYLRIVGDLHWFWFRRGLIDEGVRLLAPVVSDAADSSSAALRIRVLSGRNLIAYLAGDGPTIFDSLQRLQSALDELGPDPDDAVDRGAVAEAATMLAFFYAGAGAVDIAATFATVSRGVVDTGRDSDALGELELAVGTAGLRSGDAAAAELHLSEAIRIASDSGYDWLLASGCWILAKSRISVGDLAGARPLLGRMIEACERSYDLTSWMVGVSTIAYVAFASGEATGAGLLTGVVRHRTELTGYDPENMDPIDMARYGAEIRAGIDADRLERDAAAGAVLSRGDVSTLVARFVTG
ncbi:hypothetical protein nbrc107696_32350 [Gordonia spumicola]|uniref:Bacterial transcriptional activator domain-containing protein n=1 Tax=Gordonia spumicola TaxID=589161 RepID=A0A7I9VBQ5_9ACTN|nr:BTAD domain-containing putative transcriptional regulator [Gordonia spumicola]GEE02789.1 hypothetical protein nbrc107696_32350 [Gordonia spumicola]